MASVTQIAIFNICVAGPKLWNELPLDLRKSTSLTVFRKSLKTYLFKMFLDSR